MIGGGSGGFGGGGGGASNYLGAGGGGGGYGGGGGGNQDDTTNPFTQVTTNDYGGGGGGGSFVSASAVDVTQTAATRSGNGLVTFTYVIPKPTITGELTTDASVGSTTDTPFTGVTISDPNAFATETLTITLSDDNASLAVGTSQPVGVTFKRRRRRSLSADRFGAQRHQRTRRVDADRPLDPYGRRRQCRGADILPGPTSPTPVRTRSRQILSRPTFSDSDFTDTLGYTGRTETFTVQTSGYYDITAAGAQGGEGNVQIGHTVGGFGAQASGEVYLKAGAVLEIVVGGMGQNGGAYGSGGGGGGSFVIETNSGSGAVDVNEVIAGGGGGGGSFGQGGDAGKTQPTGGSGGTRNQGDGGVGGAGRRRGSERHGSSMAPPTLAPAAAVVLQAAKRGMAAASVA